MTTARSIVCGSCGSDVPYGRLSCPSCGDLLASVAGGRRRPSGAAAAGPASTTAAATSGGQRVPPSVLHDASEPSPMASLAFDDEPLASARSASESLPASEQADDAPLHAAPAWMAPGGVAAGGLFDDDDHESAAGHAVEAAADEDAGLAAGATAAASAPVAAPDSIEAPAPDVDEPPAADDAHDRSAAPPPIVDGAWSPAPAANLTPASFSPPPGAYVPPVTSLAGGPAVVTYALPGGPAAPARSWAGYAAADAASSAADATPRLAPSEGAAVDGERVTEFVGWLAIAGGALAAVGFLLPWGASMIGATGVGYIDRWGLAGPFHLIVALAVVALIVSVIVPNRVPAWVRIGLGGTILGMFMLGLVWPYVFGFSSTGPGALAVGLGAAALVAAGITALVTDRHARRQPPV